MDIKVVHIYNIIFTSCPNIQKILLNKKDIHVETTPCWKNIYHYHIHTHMFW